MPSRSISQSLNALPSGTVLHDYVIESELGSGGFSMVYLARHCLNANWLFAIKEYFPRELAARDNDGGTIRPMNTQSEKAFEDGLRRFRDEAEQLRTFRNEPYIVSCLNYFEENGTAYLVMDYDDGLPLSEFIERREAAGQPFTETDLLAVVEPLLEGLAVVHRAGVLHRDIKPRNIFVRRPDDITGRPAQPVLIDFGAAKQNYLEQHSRSRAPYTPGYAADEQISSEGDIGPWTDIYAVGALMWRMVAGGCPDDLRLSVAYESENYVTGSAVWSPAPCAAEKRAYALRRGRPDPMAPAAELGAGRFSRHVLKAIDRCLALDPEDRPQDCGELRALFDISARPKSTSPETHGDQSIADGFEAANKAYGRGEYEFALREYSRLAESGHAEAQYRLGEMHYYGKGVPKDHTRANQWFACAAEQGHVHAQLRLGAYYSALEDHAQAIKWLTPVAEQGRVDVQFKLGKMYKNGEGAPRDWDQAVKWFTCAAEQGDAEAQYQLGRLYQDGDDEPGVRFLRRILHNKGMPEDEAHAVKWYTRAAEQGHAKAQDALGLMFRTGVGVSEDRAQAVKWTVRAAEQGYANAQYHLGRMYHGGNGVPKDDALALQWFTRAAERGHAFARWKLGDMYADGGDKPEDDTDAQALQSFTRAAEKGNADAQYMLGCMYANGWSVSEDGTRAAQWYTAAAEQGHAKAQCRLGQMYSSGRGVPKDEAQAVKWLGRAAEQGDAKAQLELGLHYHLERKDFSQAVNWYARAAEHGNAEAQFWLGEMYAQGEGMRVNNVHAYAWANLSAENAPRFRNAAALRDEIAAKLSGAQLAEAQRVSLELKARIRNAR